MPGTTKRQENRVPTGSQSTPQPGPDEVLTILRYYHKHLQSAHYEKRISWLPADKEETPKIACYEYKGKFPGAAAHGQCTKAGAQAYKRTRPDVLKKIKAGVQTTKPRQVQQDGAHITGADKVPTVILYTEQQICDLKRFCCSAPASSSSVLGFDKTFNLGQVQVTASAFKHLAVTRKDTGDHPIFAGPMFIHGNSDYLTYSEFFSHPAAKLRGTPSQPIVGTDDEKAMKLAISDAFPKSAVYAISKAMSPIICKIKLEQTPIREERSSSLCLEPTAQPVKMTASFFISVWSKPGELCSRLLLTLANTLSLG